MSHCNQNLNLLNPLPVVKDWILFECGAVAVGLQALLSLPGPTLLLPLLSLSPKIDFNCPVLHNTTHMPIPPKAITLEVTSNIRAQILSEIDLSSLLSLLPPTESNRLIDYGDFSVALKIQDIVSEFCITFC